MEKLLKALPGHKTYVELFSGTHSLLTSKLPTANETYNDLDGDMTALFRIVRDDAKRFTQFVRGELSSIPEDAVIGDHWERVREVYTDLMSNVTDAKLSGIKGFTELSISNRRDLMRTDNGLELLMRRLRCVQYEGRRFDDIVSRFDSKETLFYADVTRLPEDVTVNEVVYILSRVVGKVIIFGAKDSEFGELIDDGWVVVDETTGTWINYRV